MNYLTEHENTKTKHFESKISEKGVITIIFCPTGISEYSASLID